MKKIGLWLGVAAITSVVIAAPSRAEAGRWKSLLKTFATQWQQLESQLSHFANSNAPVWFSLESVENGEIKQSAQIQLGGDGGLEVELGELGMPDLADWRDSVQSAVNEEEDYASAGVASNHLEREVVRAKSEGTLSEQGQQSVSQRVKETSESVAQVDQEAQAAQEETVTQKVLKRVALQNAQQAALMGSVQTELLDLSVKQDLSNRSLSNISEGLDSQNLAWQSEMEGTALSTLQTTSLAGLF
jgi:hypothetical protein